MLAVAVIAKQGYYCVPTLATHCAHAPAKELPIRVASLAPTAEMAYTYLYYVRVSIVGTNYC